MQSSEHGNLMNRNKDYKTIEDENGENVKKQALYSKNMEQERSKSSCSKKEILGITVGVLSALLLIALITAFARQSTPQCPLTQNIQNDDLSTENSYLSKSGEIFPWQNNRLPAFIVPIHYTLSMYPNLTSFDNIGSVNISFKVTTETDFVVLHSKDLNLTQVQVILRDTEAIIPVIEIQEYLKYEQLYIKVNELLKPSQKYILQIEFNQNLKESLDGFYISSYKTSNGEKRYLATTHFEPTYARAAFPCFDEPAMKATFQLIIIHNHNYNAYFNTEIQMTSPYGHGTLKTVFKKSVKMSTYLVAFVVCDFKQIKTQTNKGTVVRALVPSEQQNQAEFALNVTKNILHFYESFFGINYPLPKLDIIAIPDFAAGAMENWGLITFRMVDILYNQLETSSRSQENVATVIAHELAHQWFGNLVTMEWWNDLWLNEGFASFVEYVGVNFIQPDWKMMDQFIISTTHSALSLDSLEKSHPIMVDVKDPSEIESIFDAVSYTKGASILYMLQDFLGMDLMQKGLSTYLNKYRFANAKTEDLWNTFTEVAIETRKINISKIMDTWTRQKGFPVIYVSKNQNLVTVRQNRFLLAPSDKANHEPTDVSPYNYKWYIPITYFTDIAKEKQTYWLNMTDGKFLIPGESSWVKLNMKQTGFYRVMYDKKLWKIFNEEIQKNHKIFQPADRANLLNDAFTFAKVGILESNYAFNLTKYLEKERNFAPWVTALREFDFIYTMMQDNPDLPLFEKYVKKLLQPVAKTLGWFDEGDHLKKQLRSSVLVALIKYNDESTIQEVKKQFNEWMDNRKRIPPNFRGFIYSTGIKYGGKNEWQFCWEKYKKSQIPSEKRLLLSALGQTRDLWQLTQFLNYSLDKNKIRPQDMGLVIAIVSENPIGRLLAWRFVRMNWPYLYKKFGRGSFAMSNIISFIISSFNTQFDYDEAEFFFSSVEVGSGMKALQQSLERIRVNILWKENIEASVIQWLQNNV